MAESGARARAVVSVLERTQVGVAFLVLLSGALFVGVAGNLDTRGSLVGPLVLVLLGGGVVLAVLDLVDGPVRFWGFADSDLGFTGGRVLTWVLRLLELGVAVLVGLSVAGTGYLSTLPASPQGGGVLLAGLVGIQLLSLLLAALVLLRVGSAAVLGRLE